MPILQHPEWDRPAGGEGKPPSGFRGLLCRMGVHDWDTVHDTGYTAYIRCERCGRREITQPSGGHQPVDRTWITHGDFYPTDWSKLRLPTGSAGKPPSPTPAPPPPSRDLDRLQADVREWTRVQFPHSTQATRARHLLREAAELYAAVRWSEIVAENDDPEVLFGRLCAEVQKETNATISRIAFGLSAPGSIGEEMADILLILCDMATARVEDHGTVPWSLYQEARGKLREAKTRKYQDSPDSSGVTEHVREGSESV